MAFLDNSGDIILDAVLTDTGRKRLARGDGSFKVAKFALSDDEINYELYNKSHASGSAYYDVDILSTPVLEAFTNNTSSVKYKLITISRTNLLYLPSIVPYTGSSGTADESTFGTSSEASSTGLYLIAVDSDTVTNLVPSGGTQMGKGCIHGVTPGNAGKIRVDQGLDTTAISKEYVIDSDLKETQFIVEMDNRLGKLSDGDGTIASPSFIDDDNIASYYLTSTSDGTLVSDVGVGSATDATMNPSSIDGPRGTKLTFEIQASLELNTSEYLFNQLGLSSQITLNSKSSKFLAIDTNIRITGATTGYSVEIPVRYVKYKA